MSAPDLAAQRAVLDRVGSLEREQAVLFARQARAHAEMVRVWGADPGVFLELAGTARIGQARAGGQLGRDARLVEHFPVALGLLELGVMRVGTVQILLAVSKNCTVPVQELLDERLSERICPLDAVDVRRLVASTIAELEAELAPDSQQDRHEQARANRGVWAFPVQDGMARIGAELDQVSARRWSLDFEELVRAQKVLDDRDGIRRTQAQRRADVFAQLPSRVLALAGAATRGRLEALLAQVAAQRVSQGAAESAALAETVEAGDRAAPDAASRVGAADDVTGGGGALGVLGMAELALGLVPAPARRWWELDRDELLVGLLRLPVRNPTTMHVHTAMTTMLDLDQRSGWLEGFGPVPALHARMLLPVAELRRVAVDPHTGVPLGIDPLTGPPVPWQREFDPPEHGRQRHRAGPQTRAPRTGAQTQRERLLALLGPPMYLTDRAEPQHDPSAGLRRLVQVRDQGCDAPGCPRTATACQLDHEHDYAHGGQTAAWNLRHRSTRCHICKHHGWQVTHDLQTAVSTWLSPAGSVYERHSPWQPPLQLPADLELPTPRLVEPLDLAPDRYPADAERPLWCEPEPPETARTPHAARDRPRHPRRARQPHPDPGAQTQQQLEHQLGRRPPTLLVVAA